jgi:hypothetical protein
MILPSLPRLLNYLPFSRVMTKIKEEFWAKAQDDWNEVISQYDEVRVFCYQ